MVDKNKKDLFIDKDLSDFKCLGEAMKKVAIIGSAGAGKSTLARKMHDITHLEVVHLDLLFWKPGWIETSKGVWINIQRELVQNSEWIIDGHFQSTIDIRLNAADYVIFLDMPRLLCLWRVIKRHIMYTGRLRSDLAEGCSEKITWQYLVKIWKFSTEERYIVVEKIHSILSEKQVIWLTSPSDVHNFLDKIKVAYEKM